MLVDTPFTPFDCLYMALNMLDPHIHDVGERFVGLQKHAPNGRISLLVLWWLPLRRTLPRHYERDLNPLQMLRDTIYDLIKQEEPLLNRRVLRMIQLALTGLTIVNVKESYERFVTVHIKALLALPDAAVYTHAIVMNFERVLVDRVCRDNDYHMYWRRFCLLHTETWERYRGLEKWPSALSLPLGKSVRVSRRLGLFDDPETNNLNMDTISNNAYYYLHFQGNQVELAKRIPQELSLVWPFDSAQQVPMYDQTDWFELTRPDRDYQHFAYAAGVVLCLLAWQIGRRCLRRQPSVTQ